MAGLGHLQEKYPQIVENRGLGLMVGTEFRDAKGKPDKKTAKGVVACLFRSQHDAAHRRTWDNSIRWIPPLNVTEEQMNEALNIFEESLKETIH